MVSVRFEGPQVCMPYSTAHALAQHARRQAATIEELHERLADRENLLMLALHELAIYRQEREPQFFMYRGARRLPLHRDKRFAPRRTDGQGAA